MNTTTHNKPLGYWLAVVEHRTHRALREAFAEQGVTRREWRLLNVIAQAPATIEELKAAMPPRGRGGKRHGLRHRRHEGERMERGDRMGRSERMDRKERPTRRSTTEVLEALVERGWLTSAHGKFAITDEGSRRTAKLSEQIAIVRATVSTGISDEAYATTVSTLEAMARNLGWSPREHQK